MAKTGSPYDLPDVGRGADPGVRLPERIFLDAHGYDITTAAAKFGGTGMQIAEGLLKERQEQEDRTYHSTATTRLRTRLIDMEKGLKQEVGEGAANYSKLYAERYKKLSDEVGEETAKELGASRRARDSYNLRAQELGSTFLAHAAVYEDQERKKLYFDKLQGNVNELGIAAYKGAMSLPDALRQVGTVLADSEKTLLPDEYRDATEKAKRIVATSYLNGLAERDPQGALSFLKGKDAKTLAQWGLQASDVDRADNRARTELKRRASEARMAQAIEKATLREDAANTFASFMRGNEVPPAKMTDLSLRLRALGDEKTANTLDTLESMSGDLQMARRGSLVDFSAWVRDLKNEAAKAPEDSEPARKAMLAETLFKTHAKGLSEDPLAYAGRLFQKEMGDLGNISVDSPDAAAATMKKRVDQADYASKRLGIYVPPIFMDEAARLKAQLDGMPAEQRVAVQGRVDDVLGSDQNRRNFWATLADGNAEKRSAEAARTVSSASLARTMPGLASTIAAGREARLANKHYAPDDNQGTRAAVTTHLGNAFSLVPEAREAVTQEVMDIYAKKSRDVGDTSGKLDTGRLQESFRERFGGDLPEWNGVKVIPPQYGWDKNRWRDWLSSLPPDLGLGRKLIDGKDRGALLPVLPSVKREVNSELLARNGRFHSVGDGKYTVELEGPNGWEFLVDPSNGGKFILDRAKIRERGATPTTRRGFFEPGLDILRGYGVIQ